MNSTLKHILFSAVMMACLNITAFAQTKVVVIPLGGDVEPLENVITVAKKGGKFTNPMAALNSITNSSAANPYVIVMGPGTYDIGTASMDLKPYVAIQGSGSKQTIIRSSALSATDQYAVSLVEGSSLAGLRIHQDADIGTDVYGVVASGLGYSIHDTEIEATNVSSRAIGFAVVDDNEPSSGKISNTRFVVRDAFDQGLGKIDFSVRDASLRVSNSTFDVLDSGTAIASLGFSTNSNFLIQNSSISLHGESGNGVSNTDGDDQHYQNVHIHSNATNARGLSGAGSGFRPNFENSTISLSGTGSVGVATNNGRPKIRNSTIHAQTGLTSTSNTSVFSPTFYIDNSVISATTAVLLDTGFTLNVNFNASRLDANTKLDPGTGTINAKCVSSSDQSYNPLQGDCS